MIYNQPPERPAYTPYPQQDPGQQPYQGPYPPHAQRGQPWPPPGQQPGFALLPRARHPVRKAFLIAGGIFLAVIIILAVPWGGKQPGVAAAGSATSAAAATPAAAKSTAAAAPTITYIVTGSSADVTYGPEGSDISGSVPMRVTKKLGHAGYYSIDAQLNGGGSVTVKILVNGKVISSGRASGEYNIASAEIDQDPWTGKWENAQ